VYIQSSSEDPDLDIKNIDLNQFYEIFPEGLRARNESEASTIIRLKWLNHSNDVKKGSTIYFGFEIYCFVSFLDPSTKKELYTNVITGDWQPRLQTKAQLPPAWPIKEVAEYLRKSVATKICTNCKKEIILESWSCPHCGHIISDEEMLHAENEIRIINIVERKKSDGLGIFEISKNTLEFQNELQAGEVLPLEDGPLSRKNIVETFAQLSPVLKEDKVIQFYKNTQVAWAGGKLDELGTFFWAEGRLPYEDFIAKYRPREGNAMSIFLEHFHPLPEEYLIQFDSNLSWFILTNLRLIQKDGGSKSFSEVALSNVDTYEITGGFFSWKLTIKMKSGKTISFKQVKAYPQKQIMSWLLKNYPIK
jgi:hypothetical protein